MANYQPGTTCGDWRRTDLLPAGKPQVKCPTCPPEGGNPVHEASLQDVAMPWFQPRHTVPGWYEMSRWDEV